MTWRVTKPERLVPLSELGAVFAKYGRLKAGISLDSEDGFVTIQLVLSHEADVSLGLVATACADDVQYLADVATMRALCRQHDIPLISLEEALNRKGK